MPSAPYNPQDDAGLISSTGAVESRAFVAHYQAADPAVGAVNSVHAAAACDDTDPQVVTTSATVLASNTVDLNSALDGNQVDIYYLVEGDD